MDFETKDLLSEKFASRKKFYQARHKKIKEFMCRQAANTAASFMLLSL